LKMPNIFSKIEEEVTFDEDIIFDEEKIKQFIFKKIEKKVEKVQEQKRGFYFEEIIYDFFNYMNLPLIKSPKTRDFGIDGMVKLDLNLLGSIDVGLQIKYKLINSNDVDLFLFSLNSAEIKLGVIICKDSRTLQKYELNSKLKAILFSKVILLKEKLIKEKVDINPVFVLKLNDVIEIVSPQIRAFVKTVYKK